MDTQIISSPDVRTKIHRCNSIEQAVDLDPCGVFKRHEILVIDGINWEADLSALVDNKIEKFKPEGKPQQKIDDENLPELKVARQKLKRQIKEIYHKLYGDFDLSGAKESPAWRLMVTGPEAMHFDSFQPNGCSCILSFVNFDRAPRFWEVSYTLPELMDKLPKAVQAIHDESLFRTYNDYDIVFNVLMRESLEGLNVKLKKGNDHEPLRFYNYHRVIFPQGAFWVLNPKTVLHKVVWGAGAYIYALHCPNLPSKLLQREIIDHGYG